MQKNIVLKINLVSNLNGLGVRRVDFVHSFYIFSWIHGWNKSLTLFYDRKYIFLGVCFSRAGNGLKGLKRIP